MLAGESVAAVPAGEFAILLCRDSGRSGMVRHSVIRTAGGSGAARRNGRAAKTSERGQDLQRDPVPVRLFRRDDGELGAVLAWAGRV